MKKNIQQREIAQACELNPKTLQRMATEGLIPRPEGREGYSLETAIGVFGRLVKHYRAKAEVAGSSKSEAAARKANAEAALSEMKVAKEAGDVDDMVFIFNNAKEEIVKKICAERFGAEVEKKIFGIISDAMQGALDDLENRQA